VSLEKTLNAVSHLGAKQSTRCGGPASTKDMQTEQLLCWEWMTDTEHCTTSSSNEKEEEAEVNSDYFIGKTC